MRRDLDYVALANFRNGVLVNRVQPSPQPNEYCDSGSSSSIGLKTALSESASSAAVRPFISEDDWRLRSGCFRVCTIATGSEVPCTAVQYSNPLTVTDDARTTRTRTPNAGDDLIVRGRASAVCGSAISSTMSHCLVTLGVLVFLLQYSLYVWYTLNVLCHFL